MGRVRAGLVSTAQSLDDAEESLDPQDVVTEFSAPDWRILTETRLRMTSRLTETGRGHCRAEGPLPRTLAPASRACWCSNSGEETRGSCDSV